MTDKKGYQEGTERWARDRSFRNSCTILIDLDFILTTLKIG